MAVSCRTSCSLHATRSALEGLPVWGTNTRWQQPNKQKDNTPNITQHYATEQNSLNKVQARQRHSLFINHLKYHILKTCFMCLKSLALWVYFYYLLISYNINIFSVFFLKVWMKIQLWSISVNKIKNNWGGGQVN